MPNTIIVWPGARMSDGGAASAPPSPVTCPSCGGPVGRNRTVCGQCGALMPIEAAIQRASARTESGVRDLRRRLWARRPGHHAVLLIMALMPLVVGPAVLAALYAGWRLLGAPGRAKSEPFAGFGRGLLAVLVLALANIGLSLWFWDSFGALALERLNDLLELLTAAPDARVYEV